MTKYCYTCSYLLQGKANSYLILGVTLLTSIDRAALNEQLRIPGEPEAYVAHLAGLASEAGLDGVVASPREVEAIRRNVPAPLLVVTPGVRPRWAAAGDQKRTMTPAEAIAKGADHLVIGRPITRPPVEIGTPADAAQNIAQEIAGALATRGT